MGLSSQLELRKLRLNLRLIPRQVNTEANALTNADLQGFNPRVRLCPWIEGTPWIYLREAM